MRKFLWSVIGLVSLIPVSTVLAYSELLAEADAAYEAEKWSEASKLYQRCFEARRGLGGQKAAKAILRLAQSAQWAGDEELALNALTAFFAPPLQGFISYSAPGRLMAAEIQWQRGKREKAYKLAQNTAFRLAKFRGDKRDPEDAIGRALWLYRQYQKELGLDPAPEDASLGIPDRDPWGEEGDEPVASGQ